MRLPVRPSGARNAVRVFDGHGVASVVSSWFTSPAGRSAKLMWTDGAFPWPGLRVGGIEIDYEVGFGEARRCGGGLAARGEAAGGARLHRARPGDDRGAVAGECRRPAEPVSEGAAVSTAERALERAILAVLAADDGVTEVLGCPLRVMNVESPRPSFPHLEIVRRQSVPAGVEASEHRVDLAAASRADDAAESLAVIGAIRGAGCGRAGHRRVAIHPARARVCRHAARDRWAMADDPAAEDEPGSNIAGA